MYVSLLYASLCPTAAARLHHSRRCGLAGVFCVPVWGGGREGEGRGEGYSIAYTDDDVPGLPRTLHACIHIYAQPALAVRQCVYVNEVVHVLFFASIARPTTPLRPSPSVAMALGAADEG